MRFQQNLVNFSPNLRILNYPVRLDRVQASKELTSAAAINLEGCHLRLEHILLLKVLHSTKMRNDSPSLAQIDVSFYKSYSHAACAIDQQSDVRTI